MPPGASHVTVAHAAAAAAVSAAAVAVGARHVTGWRHARRRHDRKRRGSSRLTRFGGLVGGLISHVGTAPSAIDRSSVVCHTLPRALMPRMVYCAWLFTTLSTDDPSIFMMDREEQTQLEARYVSSPIAPS